MPIALFFQLLCGKIDELISIELNTITQHARFQELEAQWRGLEMLTTKLSQDASALVMLKLIHLSAIELENDLYSEFNSQLTKLIYRDEYDQPGGKPFSVLLLSHEVERKKIKLWNILARLGNSAFCLIIIPAKEAQEEINSSFQNFRKTFSASFTAQCLGRIRYRPLYQWQDSPHLYYARSTDNSSFVSCIYVYACLIIQSFLNHGWFFDLEASVPIHVNRPSILGQGYLLCEQHYYSKQRKGLSQEAFVIAIESVQSKNLAFENNCSVYLNNVSTDQNGGIKDLSSVLNLSRIAHSLKILLRDKISILGETECEAYLMSWIRNYCSKSNPDSPDLEFKYPLEEAKIKIKFHTKNSVSHVECLIELYLKDYRSELKLDHLPSRHYDRKITALLH